MDRFNPTAINLWLLGGSLGYVLGQGHGLALGLAITTGLSFVLSLFGR